MLLTFDPLLMSTPRCVDSEEFLGSQRPSLLLSLTDHVFINILQGEDLHWASRNWASHNFPFLCYSVYFVPSSCSSLLSSSCVFKILLVDSSIWTLDTRIQEAREETERDGSLFQANPTPDLLHRYQTSRDVLVALQECALTTS